MEVEILQLPDLLLGVLRKGFRRARTHELDVCFRYWFREIPAPELEVHLMV